MCLSILKTINFLLINFGVPNIGGPGFRPASFLFNQSVAAANVFVL